MSLPIKGSAYSFDIALADAASPADFLANPTIAAGDFKISKDGGTFINLASLPSVVPSGSIQVRIDLSSAEMNADRISVQGIDVAGAQWQDIFIFLDVPTDTAESLAVTIGTGFDASGRVDVGEWLGNAVSHGTGGPDVNVNAISDSANAAARLKQNLLNDILGVASGTLTTTTMVSDIPVVVDNQFKGRIITFNENTTTPGLRQQSTDITGSTASTNLLTFTELPIAPVIGESFVIT